RYQTSDSFDLTPRPGRTARRRAGVDLRDRRTAAEFPCGRPPFPREARTDQTATEHAVSFQPKPLSCDPARVRGMSERLIVSHYENNYCGAVKRLNLIQEQFAGLDPAAAPGFLINGLKREELIAANSMVLHELFFDGLGETG